MFLPAGQAGSPAMAAHRSPSSAESRSSSRPERRRLLERSPRHEPLETMRLQLTERTPLEQMGPLFDGPAAPPHHEHHSPYR